MILFTFYKLSVRLTLLIVALPHHLKKLKVKGRSNIAGKLEIRGYNSIKKQSACIAHYVNSKKKSNSFTTGCNILKPNTQKAKINIYKYTVHKFI